MCSQIIRQINIEQQVLMKQQKYEKESYRDFEKRYCLAEQFKYAAKGLIFIGLSRVGKSTLASLFAGATCDVVHEHKFKYTYLNPREEKLKEWVKNTQESVTEQPNFQLTKHHSIKDLAIVDMPGHADNSKFRQLINFHYIKTMAERIEEVSFVMVIKVIPEEDGYRLAEEQIKMMQSFMEIFPDCSEHLTVIINRVEKIAEEGKMKKGFIEHINSGNFSIQFKKFYQKIDEKKNLFVIERPPYAAGKNNSPYVMPNIIKTLPGSVKYMKLKNSNFGQVALFQPSNFKDSVDLAKKIIQYVEEIDEGLADINAKFIEILCQFTLSIVDKEDSASRMRNFSRLLNPMLEKYNVLQGELQKMRGVKVEFGGLSWLRCISLYNSLNLCTSQLAEVAAGQKQWYKITDNEESIVRKQLLLLSYYSKKMESIFQLILVDAMADEKQKQFVQVIRRFQLIYIRKFSQLEFLMTSVPNFSMKNINQIMETELFTGRFRFYISMTNMCDWLILKASIAQSQYIPLLQKLITQFINSLDLANLQEKQIHQVFQIVLLFNYNLQFNIKHSTDDAIQQKVQIIHLAKRKLICYAHLNSHPTIKPDIIQNIKSLLPSYALIGQFEIKLRILKKLAESLEDLKDHRGAVTILLHLGLNREAMRVLDSNEKQQAQEKYDMLMEVASTLMRKGHSQLAEQCCERAKQLFYFDQERFLKVEQLCLLNELKFKEDRQASEKRHQVLTKSVKSRSFEFWEWKKIDEDLLHIFKAHKIIVNPEEGGLVKKAISNEKGTQKIARKLSKM